MKGGSALMNGKCLLSSIHPKIVKIRIMKKSLGIALVISCFICVGMFLMNGTANANSCCSEGIEATCNPNGTCKACKNCKYCKHCSENGGSCSVCK